MTWVLDFVFLLLSLFWSLLIGLTCDKAVHGYDNKVNVGDEDEKGRGAGKQWEMMLATAKIPFALISWHTCT